MQKLKLKADAIFRRLLHRKHGKRVECPTCGQVYANEAMQVGHSFNRTQLPMRWDFRFAELQCEPCNFSGDGTERMREYLRSINPDFDDQVSEVRRQVWKRWDIEAKIEELLIFEV
jgi:hypothetical protein